MHVLNLYRLGELTTKDEYRVRAEAAFQAHGQRVAQGALSEMLLAVDWRLDAPKEVVLVAPTSRDEVAPFLRILSATGPRNRVLIVVTEAEIADMARVVPLVEGKVARAAAATAYVCQQGVCQYPTTDPEVFRAQLAGR